MWSTDAWLELLERLNRHRFRTALTTFSVAWGILMLVLLLGAGTGLGNMVEWEFRDDAINSIWIYPSSTSLPYKGHPVGRSIRLTNEDHAALAALPPVDHISSRFYLSGEYTVSHRDRHGAFSVRATHPDHLYLEKTLIRSGRFLNDLDLNRRRKVAVIGEEVKRFLFDEADPLGEYIQVNQIAYRVVGVFDDVGGPGELQRIYIPITTAQVAYGGGDRVHRIIFTMDKKNRLFDFIHHLDWTHLIEICFEEKTSCQSDEVCEPRGEIKSTYGKQFQVHHVVEETSVTNYRGNTRFLGSH